MAIINSVFGTIRQSVDNLNFRTWKDKNVIARKVTQSNQPNTEPQVYNKMKFGAIVNLSRYLLPLSRIGFKAQATSMTENNVFQKENMTALNMGLDGLLLNPKDIVISKGSLSAPIFTSALFDESQTLLSLEWADSTDGVNSFAGDVLSFAIVSPTGPKIHLEPSYFERNAGVANFVVNPSFPMAGSFLLAFFTTANGAKSSNTVAYDLEIVP